MNTESLFSLIGGLGFFFFGMKTMSEGLKKIAGNRLRDIMHAVTKHRLSAVMIGAGVTVLVQSSSATTVMVVGFVNAGLLALKQAIGVIMGANIGTTFTAWLVSSMSVFKISKYALPCIGIGFAIMSFAKTKKRQSWGSVIFGFGILFIGLHFMKEAFAPMKDSEQLKEIFITFSDNPLLGVIVGLVFTILLQSSSATIAIVQVLAFNGLITFDAAIPIILGDNIGTTITAQMAAIGANIHARRAAMSHTLFNVIGVAYMLVFVQMGWFSQLIQFVIPGSITIKNVMFYIAVAHSTFNVLNTIIFLPFVSFLEKTSIWLVPQKDDEIDIGPQYLEKHLLDTPTLAMEQIHKETIYMLSVARKAVLRSIESFLERDTKLSDRAIEYEDITDNLQSEITQYMVELSQRNLLREESQQLPVLIHNVNDIERIGDHAQNIAQLAKRRVEERLNFSENAVREIEMLRDEIQTMFNEAEMALKENNADLASNILNRENIVNKLQEDFKQAHIIRLNDGHCRMDSGFVFIELIDNLEKIGDRLTNVAQSVIVKMKWMAEKKKKLAV